MVPRQRLIECTAYCSCGHCCCWEWGLKLPGPYYIGLAPSVIPFRIRKRVKGFVNSSVPIFAKYWTSTVQVGGQYRGLTAGGKFPSQARPPILSPMSIQQYQRIPLRVLLFPWKLLPKTGTIAADTRYFPFGTRMFVPGYGWGIVDDKGSAIKGPARIDLYHNSHRDALKFGRRQLRVLVVPPGESVVDLWRVPRPLKPVVKVLNWIKGLVV